MFNKLYLLISLLIAIIFFCLVFILISQQSVIKQQSVVLLNLQPKTTGRMSSNTIQTFGNVAAENNQNDSQSLINDQNPLAVLASQINSKTVTGETKVVADKKIIISAKNFIVDSKSTYKQTEDLRIVDITENTKIYSLIEKSKDLYKKEMGNFNEKYAEVTQLPENIESELPSRFHKTETSLVNLKIGSKIIIRVDSEIKNNKEIQAVWIGIFPDNFNFSKL